MSQTELTAQELHDALDQEIDFYINFRSSMNDYTENVTEQDYRELVPSYIEHYPEFYNVLAEQVYDNDIELNTPEYFQYYEAFTLVYFNFLDELLYLVAHYNNIQDDTVDAIDVLNHLHPDDITYSIYVQLAHRDDFKLIGDVSRGFILQAIRQIQ